MKVNDIINESASAEQLTEEFDLIERNINQLAERLRADPAVDQVKVTQLPLNVSPGLALTGSTSETPGSGGSTEFRLVVVLKSTP
jgi:hypothetical protein